MKLLLKTLAALLLLALAAAGGYLIRGRMPQPKPAAAERRVLYYVDPMHPAYTSDKPGIAPDCGMKLEPVYADEPATATAKTVLYYRDPKMPEYTAEKPGLNPETGNTLEPVYAEGAATPTVPPGAIQVSPVRQQLIGVTFATAEVSSAGREIRTVGRVSYDETRVAHVHTRIEGWIEKVFVDFTGDLVTAGQPMLTIYSPEMLASQQELLLAARARDLMSNNPLASAAQHGESLFESAKRRLELWDLSADQVQQVLNTGQAIRSITLHAPSPGFVLVRNAFPNQRVTPDTDLYTIADLSRVWIMADVFESDITSITLDDPARIVFPYPGTPSIAAKVNYIQPEVDPMTRTLKVRLEASNPGLRMKPDMFVNVEFGSISSKQITVPAGALLDTGDRQTVFVDLGNGYLEPRQVTVGDRFGDRVVITRGISAGERVVSSGTFLIDSESQLKAAAGGMGAPQHDHGAAPAAPPMDPSMPMPESKAPAPTAAPMDPSMPMPGASRHD